MDFLRLAQLADGVGIFIGVFEQPCRVDFRDAAIATGGRLFVTVRSEPLLTDSLQV